MGTETLAKTDGQLLDQVGNKSRAALEILYDRHSAGAMGIALEILANRAQAEDTLQEAFWWLWKYPFLYQSADGHFTGWFYRIVWHLALTESHHCASQPLPSAPEELDHFLNENPCASAEEIQTLTDSLTAQVVRVAFSELPAQHRQVIAHAYYNGMTRQEIAERLGVSIKVVATWARLGLAQFGARINLKG